MSTPIIFIAIQCTSFWPNQTEQKCFIECFYYIMFTCMRCFICTHTRHTRLYEKKIKSYILPERWKMTVTWFQYVPVTVYSVFPAAPASQQIITSKHTTIPTTQCQQRSKGKGAGRTKIHIGETPDQSVDSHQAPTNIRSITTNSFWRAPEAHIYKCRHFIRVYSVDKDVPHVAMERERENI